MKLNRPQRANQNETIIALIDVVFFLLVFFMLIGRMDATAPFDVRPPQAFTGQDMPAGGTILALGQDGSLALAGTEMSEQALQAALQDQIKADPDMRLSINAHRGAELRRLLPLIATAETIGIRDIYLVVTPETEP